MLKEIEFSTSNGNCSASFCNNRIDPSIFIEKSSETRLGTASSNLAVLNRFHSNAVPTGPENLAGARRGSAGRP
jgi:hypothetical protein